MYHTFNKQIPKLFALIFFISLTLIIFYAEELYALDSPELDLTNKIAKSYTKKFCNAVGFGLSKESSMNFSIKENNKEFNRKKEFNNIDKELLSEKIAIAVVEKCGYPINLKGEKGIQEFKNYYLSKDKELQ